LRAQAIGAGAEGGCHHRRTDGDRRVQAEQGDHDGDQGALGRRPPGASQRRVSACQPQRHQGAVAEQTGVGSVTDDLVEVVGSHCRRAGHGLRMEPDEISAPAERVGTADGVTRDERNAEPPAKCVGDRSGQADGHESQRCHQPATDERLPQERDRSVVDRLEPTGDLARRSETINCGPLGFDRLNTAGDRLVGSGAQVVLDLRQRSAAGRAGATKPVEQLVEVGVDHVAHCTTLCTPVANTSHCADLTSSAASPTLVSRYTRRRLAASALHWLTTNPSRSSR